MVRKSASSSLASQQTESEKLLWHWLREGWKFRRLSRRPKVEQEKYIWNIKKEMKLIASKGFTDYFLMVSDIIRWAKANDILVGPGRGSAAASYVCWVLRITEVDPLPYPAMVFERFIDESRNDLPDIDIDFDDDRRWEIQRYIEGKYGTDRVGNIGTFQRYRGKNALDDVARVYKVPSWEVNKVKELIVERSGGDARFDASLEDTVEMFPQAKEVFEQYPELYHSFELEGNLKGFGIHAAGIVVGAEPLNGYVATYAREDPKTKRQRQVLSVDKYDGDHLGMLKLDALGLTTMGTLRIALELAGLETEDLYKIPMDDPKTIQAFHDADVTGIFQFEGRALRQTTEQMKPNNFHDLAAINALSRPGPLHSGTTGDYLSVREGRIERSELHPLVTEITKETEGQIIYQEQILRICREIGNFPWTAASAIRKIISNRQGESAFNSKWDEFKDGAAENGVSEETAKAIWARMVTAGSYAFNSAHCYSYSMLGFWCMWMKVHHTQAFYVAQLRKTDHADNFAKVIPILRDMKNPKFGRSLSVEPPDYNRSGADWEPTETGVIAGFSQIPGIGLSYANAIVEKREELGGFTSWEDLVLVKGIGPAKMQKIKEFAEQKDPFKVDFLRDNMNAIRKQIKDGELGIVPYPRTSASDIPYDPTRSRHTVMGVVKVRNLQDLYENHRSRTGHELDPATIRNPELAEYMTMFCEDETGPMTLKIDRFSYQKFKEQIWSVRLGHDFILANCQKNGMYGQTMKILDLWVIDPDEE